MRISSRVSAAGAIANGVTTVPGPFPYLHTEADHSTLSRSFPYPGLGESVRSDPASTDAARRNAVTFSAI